MLGDAATFLGWLDGDDLARAYASADLFLFASQTDTFGQVVLEAQASGLPVVAVDAGGPSSTIEHGRTGLLVPPEQDALASAVLTLAQRRPLRAQLSRTALAAVRERTWDAALERLAEGYRIALGEEPAVSRAVA
jgi:glycosyltransferase involved in cell wall biosynthesis